MAMPVVASAQSVFTVESDGKKYSFPLESTTITLTDEDPYQEPAAPEYKSFLKALNIFGSNTAFAFKPMHLIADNVWACNIMPSKTSFKFQSSTNTGADVYYGAGAETAASVSGATSKGSAAFFEFKDDYKQDSVMITFDERTGRYAIVGLAAEAKYHAVDFEGEKWSALIDSPEYGGKMLYGETGMGFTEDEGVYEWTDETTSLHSKLNYAWGSWAYWSGGAAVSNYHCDIADGGYTTQLSIPTDLAAHSGSNFLVTYGYSDGNAFSTDSRPVFDFKDGKARKFKGLWVTNNSYFLHSLTQGDSFNTSATDATYIDATFEGFDANGLSQGKVSCRIQDGKKSLTSWKYVDLSLLGEVTTLKVNFAFSEDQGGSYGFNAPAYIAIDDVEIYE